jgi:hypothetical protein
LNPEIYKNKWIFYGFFTQKKMTEADKGIKPILFLIHTSVQALQYREQGAAKGKCQYF